MQKTFTEHSRRNNTLNVHHVATHALLSLTSARKELEDETQYDRKTMRESLHRDAGKGKSLQTNFNKIHLILMYFLHFTDAHTATFMSTGSVIH